MIPSLTFIFLRLSLCFMDNDTELILKGHCVIYICVYIFQLMNKEKIIVPIS